MIIVAAGDSFVYGSELKDCQGCPSASTFTALLGATDCVAWPGFGNDSIARTAVARCEAGTVDAVIVSWTFPGRYEFRFNYHTGQRTGHWHTITPWTVKQDLREIAKEFKTHNQDILEDHIKTLERARSSGVADFAETYYQHVGNSEYWEIYTSLKEIVYLQNYLSVKKIPYMFTCADNSILYNHTVQSNDPVIDSLYKQIDMSKWFWFPAGTQANQTCDPRGFYQWAVENKYPIGTTHPLEQAHATAAQLMKEKFNELVKKNIQ